MDVFTDRRKRGKWAGGKGGVEGYEGDDVFSLFERLSLRHLSELTPETSREVNVLPPSADIRALI